MSEKNYGQCLQNTCGWNHTNDKVYIWDCWFYSKIWELKKKKSWNQSTKTVDSISVRCHTDKESLKYSIMNKV